MRNFTMNSMKILIFILGCLIFFSEQCLANPNTKPKILVIQSYDVEEKWSKDIYTGLKASRKFYLKPESLDYPEDGLVDEGYWEANANLFKLKYAGKGIEGIITVGKPALEFMEQFGAEMFGDMPVIATGIPSFKDEGRLKENFYAVTPDIRINKLVDRIFDIHEGLDNLIIIEGENSFFDFKIKESLEEYENQFNLKKITHCIKKDSEGIITDIKDIQGSKAVLIAPLETVIYNNQMRFKKFATRINTELNLPIYSFWSQIRGNDIIGGPLYSSYNEGKEAVTILGRILAGEKDVKKLTVLSEVKWEVDANNLKKYKLDGKIDAKAYNVPDETNWIFWSCIAISISVFLILLNYLSFNISKRKAAEKDFEKSKIKLVQVEESSKVRSDFFANITHDIRTPIGVILSIIQLLGIMERNDGVSIDKINGYYEAIKDNCNRLLRISSNLIDMTKIESGYMELEVKNYELISLIENLAMSITELCNEKKISMIFDTDAEELIVSCDGYKIERVIMNLLSNALKFTPENGEINVTVCTDEKNVHVSVKDSGIGMDTKQVNSIFERFNMVEGNQNMNAGGCGIGLFIVKSIIERHNGEVSVKSEKTVGTEFIVTLPIIKSDGDEIAFIQLNEEYNNRVNVELSSL